MFLTKYNGDNSISRVFVIFMFVTKISGKAGKAEKFEDFFIDFVFANITCLKNDKEKKKSILS